MNDLVAIFAILLLIVSACGDPGDSPSGANADAGGEVDASNEPVVPLGTSVATYEWEQRDVVYAQGQVHSDWNDPNPTAKDLEATIWDPIDTPGTRPALVIIHGGGFVGGSRMQPDLVEFAEFYAARGWFVMTISYRLLGDRPTMPPEWQEGIEASDFADVLKQIGLAVYGSTRDGKAAIRYLQASADELQIDPDSIAVMGGSAGAGVALALGVTEPGDFRDELIGVDPTLESTNLAEDGRVAVVLNHWGTPAALDAFELAFDADRWDASDAPMQLIHGTADSTVAFEESEMVRDRYLENGAVIDFYPIEGAGHGPWDAMVDGRSIIEVGFDFAVKHQGVELD